MPAIRIIAVLAALSLLGGCATPEDGFTLPAGDAEQGRAAFVKFRCFDCHQVHGAELPVGENPDQAIVQLGGEVMRAKSYSDLVTGVINPSHRLAKGYDTSLVSTDGESRMTVYNDVMTVAELVDIVTFLQEHYELRPYERTTYPEYSFAP